MDPSPETTTTAPLHAPRRAGARIGSGFTAGIAWLVCTLAVGAVAAFIALVAGIRPCWVLLVLAAPLTVALRYCGCLRAPWAGTVAAAAVVLAAFYATSLTAIARIAAIMGYPFGLAFRTGGIGLTLQVAELGLDALAVLVFAAAAVLAAVLATRLARRA